MSEDEIPRVWEAGEHDTLDTVINRHVYEALQEYICTQQPWCFNFPFVELYLGDPAELSSKKIDLSQMVLKHVADQCNQYYGSGDEEKIQFIRDYLGRLLARVDEILIQIKQNNQRPNPPPDQPVQAFMLSPEQQAKFKALFEPLDSKQE